MPVVQTPKLALTALDCCWPTDGEIVFLGPWCIVESRRAELERRRYRVLAGPWRSRDALTDAHRYVTALHDGLIAPLASSLNRLHGVRHSERYWRILLGAWLLSFLPALYDRYRTLRSALAEDQYFPTGLDPRDFVTVQSTFELPRRIIDDHYNLQIFTRLLRAMGHPFAMARVPAPSLAEPAGQQGRLRSAAAALAGVVLHSIPAARAVVARAAHFPRTAELKLALRMRGRLRPDVTRAARPAAAPKDERMRATLREALSGEGEFVAALRDILPEEIPACFVEGYAGLVQLAERSFGGRPAAILSANAWYYDEAFKHWAAAAGDAGTRLLGIQHGGNYGGGENLPSEAFEIGLVDRYYTWGWTKARYGGKVRPLPAPKLVGRKPIGADGTRHGLLLATTHMTRYLLNFVNSVQQFEGYLADHEKFVAALSPALRRALRVRLHREDFGWNIRERWRRFAPEVAIEAWDVPFLSSLRECRIYVCDHHSTTFVEALSADKPTVLFWNPDMVDLAPEFRHLYAGLSEVGILHHSPGGAARRLEEIYPSVIEWWRGTRLQQARRNFCDHLGLTAPDAIGRWAAELQAQIEPA
jgi:putative transferase (TIGR04331 family)